MAVTGNAGKTTQKIRLGAYFCRGFFVFKNRPVKGEFLMDYKKLGYDLLPLVGGVDNISKLTGNTRLEHKE